MSTSRPGKAQHSHVGSDLLIVGAVIGIGITVVCIVMDRIGAYSGAPWQTLAIGVGIPSALLGAYACLRRGIEDAE